MLRMHLVRFCLLGGLFLSALSADAAPPSAECKEGAEHCKEAFLALEQCQKAKDAAPDSCTSEKAATEQACKSTTSICHKDGSRRPPK